MKKYFTIVKFYFYLFILILSPDLLSQSTIEYQSGTNIEVQSDADICSDSLGGEGIIIINGTFCGSTTGLDIETTDSSLTIPDVFALGQNYPNPFNPSTTIRYNIPTVIASETKQSQLVTLKVYDVLGNEVATLVNEEKPAGSYEVKFNATGLSSGIYLYKIQSGNFVDTKKMTVIK